MSESSPEAPSPWGFMGFCFIPHHGSMLYGSPHFSSVLHVEAETQLHSSGDGSRIVTYYSFLGGGAFDLPFPLARK
jgi:hypothetical protein